MVINFLLPVIFSDGPRPNQKEILSLRAFLLLFVKQLIMKVNIDVNCPSHLISGCAANSGVTWIHSARLLCPVLMTVCISKNLKKILKKKDDMR